jgi:hypothetical protein
LRRYDHASRSQDAAIGGFILRLLCFAWPRVARLNSARPRRRALELLAASRDGCTEAVMLAHGFKTEMLVEMVRAGFASVATERVVAGGLKMEVARLRITEAGRRAFERTRS